MIGLFKSHSSYYFSDEDSSGHSVGSPDTGNVNNLNNSTKKPRTKRGEYSYDAS